MTPTLPLSLAPDVLPDARLRVIVALVAWAESVAVDALFQPSRGDQPVADARHLAIYLAHVMIGIDMTRLGRTFGRDRASVRHALRRIEQRRDEPLFNARVSAMETILEPLACVTPRMGDAA
ncbi:chromosomal replication initiator DnaA [Phreatobacter aquaticus]|uniref:Chromosomal replication initiator DnaA n=1 Tax=Phreatobacter aquaticus TaxID=2570229 RepID=A0A4D7QIV1_9HYPH|nr:helix-turn-helix domain-containing protein [Phreatobacter aquaticus]QCK86571.1 chromosomal replication initiator DnaA [Phreatobacter aquaticus]